MADRLQQEAYRQLVGSVSPATRVRCDEPLSKRTTLRVGGPADLYVEPADEPDLSHVLRVCAGLGLPVTVVGRGSNLLILDGGIRGVVICLGQPAFSVIGVHGESLHAGAGVRLKVLASEARRGGLTGLEFLDGIPGSVGGALRMNAGAMGSMVSAVVAKVRAMDPNGRVLELEAAAMDWGYRRCAFFDSNVALGAVFRGRPSTVENVAGCMERFNARRWGTQPKEPSAGCIFKNPGALVAGRLVEQAGMKGRRVGGARVSEVHGNFIVNDGGATARDILELIEIVKRGVLESSGVELQTEVQILGAEPPTET